MKEDPLDDLVSALRGAAVAGDAAAAARLGRLLVLDAGSPDDGEDSGPYWLRRAVALAPDDGRVATLLASVLVARAGWTVSAVIGSTTHWAEDYPWPASPDDDLDEESEDHDDWSGVHDDLDEAERLLDGVLRESPGDPAAASASAWWWDTKWELYEQLHWAAENDFDDHVPYVEDIRRVLARRGAPVARAAVAAAPFNGLCHSVLETALKACGEDPVPPTAVTSPYGWYFLEHSFPNSGSGDPLTSVVLTSDVDELRWSCDRLLAHQHPPTTLTLTVFEHGQRDRSVDLAASLTTTPGERRPRLAWPEGQPPALRSEPLPVEMPVQSWYGLACCHGRLLAA